MYPKNASSPRAIYATVVNASNGAPIDSGVVAYHIHGDTRSAVGGTAAAHIANGKWVYTPTQPETNYDAFAIEFYHASAVGDGPIVEVVTEAQTVGSGADSVTITWTAGGNPVADADVWITTDAAGNNVIAGTLQTDSNGQATFLLDAGNTYYMFGERSGVNPMKGVAFTAVAD